MSVVQRYIEERIAGLEPAGTEHFMPGIQRIRASVERIQARGGNVIFVVLPMSGYVKAINDRRYPREQFWDQFAAEIGTQTVRFESHKTQWDFTCPDGSHLDRRNKGAYTAHLITKL